MDLPDSLRVAVSLRSDPPAPVGVPLVAAVLDRTQGSFDLIPAAVILERSAHRLRDERAPTASAHLAVEACDHFLVEVMCRRTHTIWHNGRDVTRRAHTQRLRRTTAPQGDSLRLARPPDRAPTRGARRER